MQPPLPQLPPLPPAEHQRRQQRAAVLERMLTLAADDRYRQRMLEVAQAAAAGQAAPGGAADAAAAATEAALLGNGTGVESAPPAEAAPPSGTAAPASAAAGGGPQPRPQRTAAPHLTPAFRQRQQPAPPALFPAPQQSGPPSEVPLVVATATAAGPLLPQQPPAQVGPQEAELSASDMLLACMLGLQQPQQPQQPSPWQLVPQQQQEQSTPQQVQHLPRPPADAGPGQPAAAAPESVQQGQHEAGHASERRRDQAPAEQQQQQQASPERLPEFALPSPEEQPREALADAGAEGSPE